MSVVFHWAVGAVLWIALYYSTRAVFRARRESAEKKKKEQDDVKYRLNRIENSIVILDDRTSTHAKMLGEHSRRLDHERKLPLAPTTRENL